MRRELAVIGILALLVGVGTAITLPEMAVTPDHPLYDTKTEIESQVEDLAPNQSESAEAKLEHASKRANESYVMAEENETELSNQSANAYEEKMQEVNDLGQEVSDLAQERKIDEMVAKATMHHAEVLSAVYERVPEEARAGIEKALNRSVTEHQGAIEAMERRGQPTQGMNISSKIPSNVRQETGIGKPGDLPTQNGAEDTGAGPADQP